MSNIDFLKAVSKAQELVAELNSNNEDETNLNNQTPPNSPSGLTIGTKRPVDVDIDQVIEKKVKTNEEGLLAETEEILKTKEITVYHMIPEQCVGLVIGKKGLQIVQLQKDSCCKVIIPQECGKGFRELTMIGTLSQIEQAKQMINEIITRSGRIIQDNVEENNNTTSLDIMIPGPKAGLIVGRNGDTIKHIKDSSGANLVLIQDSKQASEEGKPLRITGDSQSVEKAKEMVEKLLSITTLKPIQRPVLQRSVLQRTADSCVYPVPAGKVGLVIGKGGETIREISTHSGAFVGLSSKPSADPAVKLFNIMGLRHQIGMAIRFISERAGIPVDTPQTYISAEHNFGEPTKGWEKYYHQQQQQQQQGRHDNLPIKKALVPQYPPAASSMYGSDYSDYIKEQWQLYEEWQSYSGGGGGGGDGYYDEGGYQYYEQQQQPLQPYYYNSGNLQSKRQQQQQQVSSQEGQSKVHKLAGWTVATQSR